MITFKTFFWSLWGAAVIYLILLPYFSFITKCGIFGICLVAIHTTLILKETYQSKNQSHGRNHNQT